MPHKPANGVDYKYKQNKIKLSNEHLRLSHSLSSNQCIIRRVARRNTPVLLVETTILGLGRRELRDCSESIEAESAASA